MSDDGKYWGVAGCGISWRLRLTPLMERTWSYGGKRRFYGLVLGNLMVGYWRIEKA